MKQRYLAKLAILLTILSGLGMTRSFAQCNCSYNYRVPLTITNLGSSALTNYQVSFTINTAALVAAGQMQASGSDIRFADNSCNNQNYWIESGMNTASTKIWIKVSSIPASGSVVINMYYGNPGATAGSNGDSTFILFDNFPGSSLNAAKWSTVSSGGSVTISGNTAALSWSTYDLVESVNSYPGPITSEINVLSASGSYPNMAQADNSNYNSGACMFTNSSSIYFYTTSGSPAYASSFVNTQSVGSEVGVWSFTRSSSGLVCVWPGGSFSTASYGSSNNQSFGWGGLNGSAGAMTVSWFRARAYSASGASVSVGTAVPNGGIILPAITGSTVACLGGGTTTLSDGFAGGSWISGNTTVGSIGSSTGVVTPVGAGTVIMTYSIGACATPVTYTMTVNNVPAAITGNANVCSATADTLYDASPLGAWSSGNPTVATIGGGNGVISALTQGYATMSYTLPTGCYSVYSTTVNISPSPYTVSVTGTGVYCAGSTPPSVMLSSSDVLINYKLYLNGSPLGTYPGVGYTLNFGPQATSGNYSVIATNTNGGCSLAMTPTVTVTANTPPSLHSVMPGGITSYCAGGSGVNIGLNGSDTRVKYQLMRFTGAIGSPIVGSGSGFYFGDQTLGGVYTVVGTDTVTGCSTTMTGNQTINVNPLPNIEPVTGGGNYCLYGSGVPIYLGSSQTGVNYQLQFVGGGTYGSIVSGTSGMLTFPGITPAGYYNIVATYVGSGCSTLMSGIAAVAIDPLPEVDTAFAENGGYYCSGGAGKHIYLNYSSPGVQYQLYLTGYGNIGLPVEGTGDTLNFGVQTMSGSYVVYAQNDVTHCNNTMAGAASITVNPLPMPQTVMGGGPYCSGGAGVPVTLGGSATGVVYQLYRNSIYTGMSDTSTGGGALSFGNQTSGGTYTVMAVNPATGCTGNMTGSAMVTVNPLPVAEAISGGGAYCAGSGGKHIYLDSSQSGISYQLYFDGSAHGLPMSGGGVLDFGSDTGVGSYTIVGTNSVTACVNNMSGEVSISQNPLPQVFNVTGGGAYCSGSAGDTIGLSFSNVGVQYQLMLNGTTTVGLPLEGLGSSLNFGYQTSTGVYSIAAKNDITGCTDMMSGSKLVSVTLSPTKYSVTGGGGYCAGGSGVAVGLAASNIGVSYQLYDGITIDGIAASGTGYPLAFGNKTSTGVYTVVATNTTSGCTDTMLSSAMVTVNALPTMYTVIDGGAYCAGGVGVPVKLSSSDTGVSYYLTQDSTEVGIEGGTGSTLSFGNQTVAGIYYVSAKNNATGCRNNMSGSAAVIINPLPTAVGVSGGGGYCVGGPGVPVGIGGSNVGINYILTLTGVGAVTSASGSGSAVTFGNQMAPGVYSVSAINTTTGCSNAMSGTATVVVNPLPTLYSVTGGGSYCADSAAPHVMLSNTQMGLQYSLFSGSGMIGAPWTGAGLPIDFGAIGVSGGYFVVASNPATGCMSNMHDTVSVNRMPLTYPSVTTMASTATTICAGTAVTYTATPTNGGSTPAYQWMVNGSIVATGSTYTYNPGNGDVVTVVLTSNASCPAGPAASTPITMIVNPTVTVGVTDSTITDSVCQGSTAFFYAIPHNGGLTPVYDWYYNGVLVQSGAGQTYSWLPATGDQVYVQMRSSEPCASADSVEGGTITMYVQPVRIPAVTISSTGDTVKNGAAITFTANATNVTIPMYQWSLNAAPIAGATNTTYMAYGFSDGDVVSCAVTNDDLCGMHTGSAFKTIHILPEGVQQVSTGTSNITVAPNPSKGQFSIRGSFGSIDEHEATVEVTNMLGQVVYSSKAALANGLIDETVQLPNGLANGMYLLNVHSDGSSTLVHIVVEQ